MIHLSTETVAFALLAVSAGSVLIDIVLDMVQVKVI